MVFDTFSDAIYDMYPRHVARRVATKAIERALLRVMGRFEHDENRSDPTMDAVDFMVNRTHWYAKATKRWPEPDKKFIPHPATWFNQDRFDDDPKEWDRTNERDRHVQGVVRADRRAKTI